jgi:hypothetical protein
MSFAAFMTETITIRTPTKDQWGASTWTTEDVDGRVENTTTQTFNKKGEQVGSAARVWIEDMTITTDCVVQIASVNYPIIALHQVPGRSGSNHHIKIELGAGEAA